MTQYKTSREKLKEFYQLRVYPSLMNNELGIDYIKFIDAIVNETGISEKIVKEFIQTEIRSGKLIYQKIETIQVNKKEQKNFLDKLKESQKEIEKEVEEAIENVEEGGEKKTLGSDFL